MIESAKTRRAEYFRSVMIDLAGIDPMERSRRRDPVTARMIVANELYSEGCTEPQIGAMLGVRACTVHYYRDRMLNIGCPGWDAERELFELFKRVIDSDASV